MTVQTVVDKQLGAILQGGQIIGPGGRLVPDSAAGVGLSTGHQAGRSNQGEDQFFHGYGSHAQWAAKITRSGTRLKVPNRLHHGISRKKPK